MSVTLVSAVACRLLHGVGSRAASYLPEEQVAVELGKVEFVTHTKHTVTSRKKLEEILLQVRTDQYALNDRSWKSGCARSRFRCEMSLEPSSRR